MKQNTVSRFLLLGIALICLIVASAFAMTSCQQTDTEPPITTTEAPDPGFSLSGNTSVRVEADKDSSFLLYIDAENSSVDLNALSSGMKSFTVTDSSGALVEGNVITVTKSGESFTVYYGDDKIIYRITVYFNEYVTVTFEGLDTPVKVLKGGKAVVPESVPRKVGNTFVGWDFDFETTINADLTISAKWKPATYTVTFDTKGGTLASNTMTVTYGEAVALPVPTKNGYVFTGWHDGVSVVNSGVWTVDKDVTLIAMWDNHDYKITYDPNGGEVDKTLQGVSYGDPFTTPTPKRAGYTFLGWYCDGELINTTSYPYREDKTFIAEWQENVYNVTFESNGGSVIEGGEYLYSQMAAIVPVREGYTFGGWFFDTDLTMTDTDISVSDSVIAYAWWTEEDKPCDYRYEIAENGVVILGYEADSDTCILPSFIGGKPIVEIGTRAFFESSLVSISFPSSVTAIGDYAFFGCKLLAKINAIESESKTQMICLDGVSSIGAYAFMACTFAEITLPQTVKTLSDGLFYDCQNLVSINLESITKVGNAVFQGCVSLKSLSFSDSVTSFGNDVFRGCLSLETVTLPKKLTSLGNGTFAGCSSLSSLTLPTSLTSIGNETFIGCALLTKLENFLTSTKITSIGAYAFAGCANLTTVGVPVSVKEIGAYAFLNCQKLEGLTLPVGISKIANGTFKNCSYLTSIQITTPIVDIGSEAFYGCRRLAKIALTESLLSIGDSAFENCMALTDVTLGSNLNSLGKNAFKGCTRLSAITISNKITVISEGVFDGCLALSKITWHNGITEIGARAFADCQAISFDFFPTSCAIIGDEAFSGCRAIQTLSINQVLTYIGSRAFADCISLSKISFSGTNERWKGAVADDAFVGCDDLKTVETVTWTYDDLRPWITSNSTTNALWAMDKTHAFNGKRPAAVILFKPNNVFYKNLITVNENGAVVNSDYIWKLDIEGATEMISSFTSTITVTTFDVYNVDGYGFVRMDLGELLASLQGLKHCTLNLSIYAKDDESKILYSAPLGKVTFAEDKTDLTPDSDRTCEYEATVSTTTEGAAALFDGKLSGDYFTHDSKAIVIKGESAFQMSSYSLMTSVSQASYPTTVPKSWTLYGGIVLKDGTVEWVEIDRVDNSWITSEALCEYNFKVSLDRAYQQYKIEFDQSGVISFAEMVIYKQ